MTDMSADLEARIAAKVIDGGEPVDEQDDEQLQPAADAPPADESTETPDPAATTDELIFGKYRSLEEAQRAFSQLESKLGEQGLELGDLRQRQVELESHVEKSAQPRYDSERLDEWLDENLVQVPQLAEEARKRGDTALYEAAMEKWHEVSPRQASAYERHLEMQQLRHEMGSTAAELTAPAQALQVREAQQEAVSSLTRKFEDFADVVGGMSEDAVGEILSDPLFPSEILTQINPGDPRGQEKLLGTLYAFAKARQVGPISEAATTAALTAVESDRRAKRDGSLPASKGTATQPQAPDANIEVKNAFRESFGLPLLEK